MARIKFLSLEKLHVYNSMVLDEYLIIQYCEGVGRQNSYKDFIPIAYDSMNNRATQSGQPDYSWPIDRVVHTSTLWQRFLYKDLIRSTKQTKQRTAV